MIVMDVAQRNFFRLLREGAFNVTTAPVEPMSPWKWSMLYNIAMMHGVVALVYDGVKKHENDFYLQLPPELKQRWGKAADDIAAANTRCEDCLSELFSSLNHEQLRPILLRGQSLAQLYDNPLSRTCGDIDIFFPYEAQAAKADHWATSNGKEASKTDDETFKYKWNGLDVEHYRHAQRLTNPMLNKKLQSIINKEIRCCDSTYIHIGETKVETLPPTLCLLMMIVRIARYTLNEGIRLKQLVDMGMLLRKIGNQVDFVKLQKWLEQLKLTQMAQLEGAMLADFLDFETVEIPFMDNRANKNTGQVRKDIFSSSATHNEDWYFTQGKNIFVRASNSGAMTWQMKHLARFFAYYPTEALTSFATSFAHSISHIEE